MFSIVVHQWIDCPYCAIEGIKHNQRLLSFRWTPRMPISSSRFYRFLDYMRTEPSESCLSNLFQISFVGDLNQWDYRVQFGKDFRPVGTINSANPTHLDEYISLLVLSKRQSYQNKKFFNWPFRFKICSSDASSPTDFLCASYSRWFSVILWEINF